ncbi:unnamed protein product [Ilex paraguariensis]|uniref:Uncharacterized protein n=1 Tax=Ilex paraguariensis TaxID=185542 RepID=A0ABC8UW10_9AQUA
MGWYVASLWLLPSTGLVPVDLSMCCAGGVSVCAQLVLLLLPAVLLPLFFDAACPGLELLCSSGFQLYCSWSLRLQAHGIRPKAAEGIMGTEFLQAIKVEVRYELKPKLGSSLLGLPQMGPCGLAGHYGFMWGSWSLIIAVVGSIRFFICYYGQECTVHVNSLLSAGLCFQLLSEVVFGSVQLVTPEVKLEIAIGFPNLALGVHVEESLRLMTAGVTGTMKTVHPVLHIDFFLEEW